MGTKLIRSKLANTLWKDPELRKFIRQVKDKDERSALLTQKLFEELGEFMAAFQSGSRYKVCEEAGDVIDVLYALAYERGAHTDQVRLTRRNKCDESGGFIESNYVWESQA